MYEKITKYADIFSKDAASPADRKKEIQSFIADFSQSGYMNPDALQVMGERGWISRSVLKNDLPSMTAEDICACFSAFIQQESFIEGIILDTIEKGILQELLERLKEQDS